MDDATLRPSRPGATETPDLTTTDETRCLPRLRYRLEHSAREAGATFLSLALVLAACWVPFALVYRIQYSVRTHAFELAFAPTGIGNANRAIFVGLVLVTGAGAVAALVGKAMRKALRMCPRSSGDGQMPTGPGHTTEGLSHRGMSADEPRGPRPRAEAPATVGGRTGSYRLRAPRRVRAARGPLGRLIPPM